jgi:two-component system, cell cycle sensor histidine kinase and response regulator CckA
MNLLIVDDHPTDMKLLHAQLESEGHAVFEAHDGVDALALLNRQRVDAVISDILMPRMDGYRLCYEIRKHARLHDLPIIIYSATYTSPDDETLALDMGADKYLKKPVPVETIITALLEVIAKPHAAPQPKALQEVEVLKRYNERLVSKLKEKNTELQAAAVKFRALVEQSIVGIYIIQDDQFVYVNPKMAGIFGRSEEEMTSRTIYDFVVPEDHTLARENIRKRISGEVSSMHYYLQVLHQSGAVLQVEVHSSWADYNGRPAVMGLLLDITERKRAEERLRSSEERFRALVENSSDGIMLLDRDSNVFYASPAMARILGCDVDELIGTTPFKLVHPDDLHLVYGRFEAVLAAESVPILAETRYRHKNGSWRYLETVRTNRLNEPAVHGVVVNYRDVTERLRSQEEHRRMEHRLEQAQRIDSLGRVAATIAHEFNNVLMGIQPFAEVISRRAGDDERISKAAEQISNSVRRGKRVTDDILRFTRPIEPQVEVIDMGKWVAQIEPELRSVAGSSVQITASVPGKPLFARCDAAQMQQVATNLVINARDAMPNGGTITLTLATSTREDNLLIGMGEDERFVHLSVRDNGSGIAPEMLEQIFEPLFTTKRSGTGLGLAVARRVLTQHGGFIFAENAPGGGTAFHILLPRVDEALSTAVAVAAQKINGRIRRLLLVEDEVSVTAGLSSLLELEEIVVRVVGLGREVVPAIEEFAPDAVVLDLTLPDIDGREVFAQIVARWPDLPVVFSTGHGSEAELAHELARDHIGFLRKPYEVVALMAAIERVL